MKQWNSKVETALKQETIKSGGKDWRTKARLALYKHKREPAMEHFCDNFSSSKLRYRYRVRVLVIRYI